MILWPGKKQNGDAASKRTAVYFLGAQESTEEDALKLLHSGLFGTFSAPEKAHVFPNPAYP